MEQITTAFSYVLVLVKVGKDREIEENLSDLKELLFLLALVKTLDLGKCYSFFNSHNSQRATNFPDSFKSQSPFLLRQYEPEFNFSEIWSHS